MNNEEKKNTQNESDASETSKGERLRLARESLGLEAEDVATKLYFEIRFIRALESDDYSIFAGSAYLYGYMRAYVKLLDLPMDEFVNDLKNFEEENEHQFETVSYQTIPLKGNRKWLLPVLVVLLLIVAGVVGFILINGKDSSQAHSLAGSGKKVAKAQTTQGITIPFGDASVTASSVVGARVKTKTGQMATSKLNAVAAASPAKVNVAPLPRLQLDYKADSWTEIHDANGKRLVYRMVEKGNRLELDSSSSYSVLLGYSPGVSVTWNDHPFDTSGYERKNRASFVLGKEKKTPPATTMQK